MYCKNCGKKLEEGKKFCSNCGTKKDEEIIEVKIENDPATKDENHLANVLCTISLCLYFGGSTVIAILSGILSAAPLARPLAALLSLLSGLSPIAAYVLMIIARVKCPKSTYAKVVMWIYIALFILSIIAFIILMLTCSALIIACGEELGELGSMGMIW